MKETKNQLIKSVTDKIRQVLKKNNSTEQLLDFAFNFQYHGFNLQPLQNKSEIKAFLQVIEKLKPKIIVEIGTANGGTLFLLTQLANINAIIISIDLPEGEFGGEFYPRWKESIYTSFGKPGQKIHLIRANSHDTSTVKQLSAILNENKIDLLLIDGDHTFEGVKMDFEMYKKFVSDDGIIVFHDINDKSHKNVQVAEFWSEIKKKHESFEIIFNNPGTGFGLGIIINHPNNEIISKIIVKELDRAKNMTIKKLLNNPLSALISLYDQRLDLQKYFPEVEEGDFSKLIVWVAYNLGNEKSNELDLKNYLNEFSKWYENYSKLYDDSHKVEVLQKVVGEEDVTLKELERVVGEKDVTLKELERVVGEKDVTLKELERVVGEKDVTLKELERVVGEKDVTLKELERVVGEKDVTLKELERVVGEKDVTLKELERVVGEKDNKISEINELNNQKIMELYKLKNELSSRESELIYVKNNLSEIENSLIYKQMKKFANSIDIVFPNNSRRGELKKIINESLRYISKNGFSDYNESVKTKIKRREFKIVTPLEISKYDERTLVEEVKKNKKNRLIIKAHENKELQKDSLPIPKDDKLV